MRFEKPETAVFKQDILERRKALKERLKEHLKLEAKRLRELGLAVDDELRIEPDAFAEELGEMAITEDRKAVQEFELKHKIDEAAPEKVKGDLLEFGKTLAVNKWLFGGRFIAVRTAKYDDYFNHADELILDTETKMPFAAVDTTTNVKTKAKEVFDRIKNGCKIKYGYGFSEEGVVEQIAYEKLPLFIIYVNDEKLDDLAQGVGTDAFEEEILDSLQKQSQAYAKIAAPEVRRQYDQAAEIFEKMSSK